MRTGAYYVKRRISRNKVQTIAECDTAKLGLIMEFVNHLNKTRVDAYYYLNRFPTKTWRGEEDPEITEFKHRTT